MKKIVLDLYRFPAMVKGAGEKVITFDSENIGGDFKTALQLGLQDLVYCEDGYKPSLETIKPSEGYKYAFFTEGCEIKGFVAYAEAAKNKDDLGHCFILFKDFYVFPKYRNQKVGTWLIAFLGNTAIIKGYKTIRCHCISCKSYDKSAERFYHKLGFKVSRSRLIEFAA